MILTVKQRRRRTDTVTSLKVITKKLGAMADNLADLPRTEVVRDELRYARKILETAVETLKKID